jgi:hypothetical protein
VLALALVLWLSCPPTADPDAAPRDMPGRLTPASASPYDHLTDDRGPVDWAALEVAPIAELELPDLPLWDLEATLAALEDAGDEDDARWLRWTIATIQERPATAHAALARALGSDSLSAGVLLRHR